MNDPLTILFSEADEKTKASLALSYLISLMNGVKPGLRLELKTTTMDDKVFMVTVEEEIETS